MSEHDVQSAEALGPYAVFLHHGYDDPRSRKATVLAACTCTFGVLGFALLVSVGFSGSLLVLGLGVATSVLALVVGAYSGNAAAGSGGGRAAAIVGMSTAAMAILGSTGLAVFAVWQTP